MQEAWQRLLDELLRLWKALVNAGYVDWAIYLAKRLAT